MSGWVPEVFTDLILDAVGRGETPRVSVRQLVRWFGFERRGSKVNGYIVAAMNENGVVCTPTFEAAFADDDLTFSAFAPTRWPAPPFSSSPKQPKRGLPFPFAHFDAIVAGQQSVIKRVKTRLDGMERAIAYLVFCQLAALREASGGTYPDAVRKVVVGLLSKDATPGPPVSFGTWVHLARRLAGRSASLGHPALEAGRAAFDGPASVGGTIASTVVRLRNNLSHGSSIPARTYADAEPGLVDIDRALRTKLAPLLDSELVCVKETEVGEHEAYRFRLRSLHGTNGYFSSHTLETRHKLATGWAYLLCGQLPPLRLAPGICCVEDEATEQVELFFFVAPSRSTRITRSAFSL